MVWYSEFCDSPFWDSNLTWHNANPDFTSCFKNTALVWTPCILLWVLSPLEIYFIKSAKSRNIPYGLSGTVKLVFIIFIVALNLIETVDYVIFDKGRIIRVYNAVLKLITYILFLSLILANNKKGLRCSGILLSFTLLSAICGIPQFRTIVVQGWAILQNDPEVTDSISYLLQYMSIFVISLLSFCADSEPSYSSCKSNRNVCPSHNASYASKITLSWFDQYVWRNSRKPVEDNLWDLDQEDRAANITYKLEKYLTKFPRKIRYEDVDQSHKESKTNISADKDENFSTRKFLFYKYKVAIFTGALWRSLDALMTVNYPILFSLLISYTHETETPWKMYLCAFSFLINSATNSIVLAKYYEGVVKLQIRIRATLVSLIYKKILKTSDRVRRGYTSGEMVNLMTVDINRIIDMTVFTHYLWLTPFQFFLSFYFVWKAFGFCTLVSIIIMILLIPINIYLFNIMMKYSDDETTHRDKRGKFIQDLLTGIKILKMYAWESSFEKKASSLRQEETNILKKSANLHVWLLFMYNCIPPLMSVISFAAYYLFTGNLIDVEKAFITISFFNTFKTPLRLMSNYFPSMMQALISLKRIDDFLNLPEPDDTAISHDPIDASLLMENATFSWNGLQGPMVLHDLNMKVNRGSLISVVGCVGAGKTSLISAFLGEMKKVSGYVNVNGKIAYVPQQAWILNATFRDNITLGEPVDRFLYKSALKACALHKDLSTFPAGDLTEIGEKGINLSGGQKQRITIARAICRNADIYFLDDSLSAVDVRVSEHIFQCVLGPSGILNQKTRVLVTHNTTFLSQSDQVIVLKDGCIVESGVYEDLVAKDGYLTAFLAHEAKTIEDGDNFRVKIEENSIDENEISIFRDPNDDDIITTDTKLIEKENVAISTVKKEVYLFYLSVIGISTVSLVLIFNILNQVFSLSSRLWLTSWSSANTAEGSSDSQTFYLSIYAALGLAEALSAALGNRLLLKEIYDATSTIYNQLISSVLRWPLWLLDSTPVGRIMNRATSDVHILDNIACKRSVAFLELGHRFLFILLILCYIIPINILIFTTVFAIVYVVQRYYQSLNFQLSRINSNNMAPMSSFIVETVYGLSSIRANGFQKKFISLLYDKVDLYSSAMFPIITGNRWISIRLETLYGLTVSFVIVLILRQRDILGHGMMCFAISYAIQWTKEFQWFLCYLMELHNSTISIERIKEYTEMPQENIDKRTQAIPTRWPHKGEIQFQNYKLRYRQSDDVVLKGLTFSVKSGEKIGIIGRTGAGKSSLILGLLRLVEPADGTIVIDNIDIRRMDLKILRSRLTIIPQDPVLFLGTLRFNLDPTERYLDESLWNALEKAHLRQFVQHLPNGLEYHVEEGGANLSCGQKQLLCLARALLRKTKILILDEATASVDIETDDLIQNTIRNEFGQCTVLTVAHRVHTIQDYDRILVMDAGRVIEYDTPENLLKKTSSVFYNIMLKSGLITR